MPTMRQMTFGGRAPSLPAGVELMLRRTDERVRYRVSLSVCLSVCLSLYCCGVPALLNYFRNKRNNKRN